MANKKETKKNCTKESQVLKYLRKREKDGNQKHILTINTIKTKLDFQ